MVPVQASSLDLLMDPDLVRAAQPSLKQFTLSRDRLRLSMATPAMFGGVRIAPCASESLSIIRGCQYPE